jgi:hypothetical protein
LRMTQCVLRPYWLLVLWCRYAKSVRWFHKSFSNDVWNLNYVLWENTYLCELGHCGGTYVRLFQGSWICLKKPRKVMKAVSQDSQFPYRYLVKYPLNANKMSWCVGELAWCISEWNSWGLQVLTAITEILILVTFVSN